MLNEVIKKFRQAEKNRTFPFSEWHRKDVFEKLIRDILIILNYNPDQFNYEDSKGINEIEIKNDLKAIFYLSSLQENQRFLSNKISAPIDTLPDPETGKPTYEIAIVTNFDTWFFYFDGREIYAVSADRLENEFETIKALISKEAIESGKFKEVARKLLLKEDNEPLRQELNLLREKIANKIIKEETNILFLKNPDGSYNNEILNEITTRWITRFLSLKLAEDSGISFNFTLRDIRRSFELSGKVAKTVPGAKVKEETLSNAIRALMNEFERRYNGGIFMYEEGVDYITIPDTAFFDLLDFATGWAFTIEDARIIGFVYERFLGQEIVVEKRKGKPEAVLKKIGEARGKRKAGGIYYTPKYIVDYIVENTLGEILKEKRQEIDNAVKNLDCEKFLSIVKEVKSLKVLDPACGSGSFLIKLLAEFKNFYDEIKNRAKEIKSNIDALRRERTKGQLLFTDDEEVNELLSKYREIDNELEELKSPGVFALRHNIYGVDLDPKAIDITAFTLMVQVYDELKDGARCPTMIGENLKVGNSLVSAITPEERNGFISRKELEEFKDDISKLISLREKEKNIDILDEFGLRELIEENFDDVIEIYKVIKEKYPNAIPTHEQKLLNEWYKRAKKEPKEKTFDVLINQTGLARIFLKEVYFERIRKIKEKIENEINKPLIRYFNSKKRVLKDKEFEEILMDEKRLKEELRFVKDRALVISKSQPPKAFNWEIEFPEVFFDENGSLKENPGFDCIVGNPPWLSTKGKFKIFGIGENIVSYLENTLSINIYRPNIFEAFIRRSLSLLKINGLHSFIVPERLCSNEQFINLRKQILENFCLKCLQFKVKFPGVISDNIIYCIEKFKRDNFSIKISEYPSAQTNIISQNEYVNHPSKEWFYISNDLYNIFKSSIISKSSKLCELYGGIFKTGVGFIAKHGKITEKSIFVNQIPIVKGEDIVRYCVIKNHWFEFKKDYLVGGTQDKTKLGIKIKIFLRKTGLKLQAQLDNNGLYPEQSLYFIYSEVANINQFKYICSLLNSAVLNCFYKFFTITNRDSTPQLKKISLDTFPIYPATPAQQSPLISLVDAIISRKKEYHSISQNIENYIKLEDCKILTLEDFIKRTIENFEITSSIKVKNDNFDALRIKIENNEAILEYGIKKKSEEFEIEDEEGIETEEKRSKCIIEWFEAGKGKIKDREAIEFLAKILENESRISKAKQKSIWQKIAEVKVPEFNEKVKKNFLNYKSAMEKAEKLDEEITKIDRAIDRLVYDLYGLTEEEIQVVEKSVWGEKFNKMYEKLPSKKDALRLSKEYKNG